MFLIFVIFPLLAAEIQIRELTYVSSPTISLGDIAIFKEVSKKDEKKIANIVLSNDLQVGVERVFQKSALIGILKKFDSAKTKFILPEKAVVKRKEDRFSKENVIKKLESELTKTQVGVDIIVDSLDLVTSSHPVIDWEIDIPTSLRSSYLILPIKMTYVINGKEVEKAETLRAKLKFYQTVPVVTENVFQGQRLDANLLQLKKIEVLRNQLYVTNTKDVIGKKLKRSLRQGDPIRSSDLEKEYEVRAGQNVKILVTEKDVRLSLDGVSKQNGMLGDVIRVTNPLTNKVFMATVTGGSEVEVK